jgi:phage gp36-like protein
MYGTIDLFIEAFGEVEATVLTNLDNPNALSIDSVRLDRALVDGAALIDSYIGRRYLLPLDFTPEVLVPYALDIARYRLDRIRNREDVRVRYEDAIKWLEGIASGKWQLGIDTVLSQPVTPTTTAGQVTYGVAPSIDLVGF